MAEIIIHPKFNAIDCSNDIAIIKVANRMFFNDFVQPICLWQSDKADLSTVIGRAGTLVGWRTTETGKQSTALWRSALPVVDSMVCLQSNRLIYGNYLSESNFCAGDRNGKCTQEDRLNVKSNSN